jgi:hypothetical protein
MYGLTNREDFVGMESGEDSGVDLLFSFDEGHKPTGVIINLACPSQVMESTYLISSDFMGEIRRLLKQRFGESFRTLGQISAAGCQSPRDLARNYRGEPDFWHADGVTEIGRRLLAAVESVFPHAAANIDESPVMRRNYLFAEAPRGLPGIFPSEEAVGSTPSRDVRGRSFSRLLSGSRTQRKDSRPSRAL